jgi:HD-like signal output (HDOD) protein
MRNLRTWMYALSVRSSILRDKRLSRYAEDVWRQSYSMASIARAIAKPAGFDPDRAFLLGLVADIGKVSLLAMLRKELQKNIEVSPPLVGRVFYLFHENAGARLGRTWHLPEDVVGVVETHHHYEKNERNPRDAALVSLANRLDILLARDEEQEFRNAIRAPEFEMLKLEEDRRWAILEAARGAFSRTAPIHA